MSKKKPTVANLDYSLFCLRIGVFIVMVMWTIDKILNPVHASNVWGNFYMIAGMGDSILLLIAIVESILILLFVIGLFKRYTYGLVFLAHLVSTVASYPKYFQAFDNLTFFAAWPMLAACLTLYLLREHDTFLTLKLGK